MCNQCQDYRAIHNQRKVFGVFHNGKFVMAQATKVNAERSIAIMQGNWCTCSDDSCVYEIFEIERKDVIWES